MSAPAIETVGLTKFYGESRGIEELDLRVECGEVLGYLGPNGAGKTTTIRLLLGLHRPSGGRAALFGVDAWRNPVAAHRRVAYVAGEPYLWPGLTGAETLEFLANVRGGADAAYRDLLVERFQLDTNKKMRALSKGNRQNVQLIAALASRADLLILDEPTSGLDPLMEMAFRDSVREAKERGQTVFLSSHILSEVEAVCDRVGILRSGRLVDEGTLAELRHLKAQTVEVTFDGSVPELAALPGVAIASAGRNALRFEVSGEIGPLIAALAEHPVRSLISREPPSSSSDLARSPSRSSPAPRPRSSTSSSPPLSSGRRSERCSTSPGGSSRSRPSTTLGSSRRRPLRHGLPCSCWRWRRLQRLLPHGPSGDVISSGRSGQVKEQTVSETRECIDTPRSRPRVRVRDVPERLASQVLRERVVERLAAREQPVEDDAETERACGSW